MDESAAIDLCGLADDLPTEQARGSHSVVGMESNNTGTAVWCGDLVAEAHRVWWVSRQGKLPLSGISVNKLEDSADHKNAFEIAGKVPVKMQGGWCFVMGDMLFNVTYFGAKYVSASSNPVLNGLRVKGTW